MREVPASCFGNLRCELVGLIRAVSVSQGRDKGSSPSVACSEMVRHKGEWSNTLRARRRDSYSALRGSTKEATEAREGYGLHGQAGRQRRLEEDEEARRGKDGLMMARSNMGCSAIKPWCSSNQETCRSDARGPLIARQSRHNPGRAGKVAA